ncbi:MAG: DUF3857 domain-containing protein [Thermoanaerobaculia bacterium]
MLRDLRGRVVLLLLSAVLLSSSLLAADQEPWSQAFAPDTRAILERADTLTAGSQNPVEVLLLDTTYGIDAKGAITLTRREVYTILDESAVEDWSGISQGWASWYEQRPEIEARVITPDGAVHPFDPSTIADAPSREISNRMYTDTRVTRAPLPAVKKGSVVEFRITKRGTLPLFEAGVVTRVPMSAGAPSREIRLTVDAPADVPLRFAVRTTPPIEPIETRQDGRIRYQFQLGPVPAIEDYEFLTPSDVHQFPYVAFTTGKSWGDVATAYEAVVAKQLDGAELKSVVAPAIRGAKGDREKIDRILALLQSQVRYTGVEFSEASIVPRTPAETLARRFGDCKDKATLLTGMLRAAGMEAAVVLLDSGAGAYVDPELPGMGGFNHAIVHVSRPVDLWIDPTDEFSRAGELPIADQGHWALIAAASTKDLVRTPHSVSTDNRISEMREFTLPQRGPAQIVETSRYTGAPESEMRAEYASRDAKSIKSNLEGYARTAYVAKEDPKIDVSDPNDLTRPFRIRIEIPKGSRGITTQSEAVVGILPGELFSELPWVLRSGSDDQDDKKEEKTRKNDFELPEPYVKEWTYRIVAPDGFAPRALPPDESKDLGTMRFEKKFVTEPSGAVTAHLTLDTGKARLTPAEFEATKKALADLDGKPILIGFDQIGEADLAAGKVGDALKEFRRLARAYPKEAVHHARIARALLAGSMGELARAEAHQAIAADPKSSVGYEALAWILQFDMIGRRFKSGWDRAGAVEAYRKAMELDPENGLIPWNLGILLEFDEHGARFGAGADLKGAIEAFEKARKLEKSGDLDQLYLTALLWAGRYADVEKEESSTFAFPVRDELRLTAIAAERGSEAAIVEGQKLRSDPDKRRELLDAVGGSLMVLRLYQPAADMFSATLNGASNAAEKAVLIDTLRKAKKHEEMKIDDATPEGLIRKLLVTVLTDPSLEGETLIPFFAARTREELVEKEDLEGMVALASLVRQMLGSAGMGGDLVADLALPSLEFIRDGNEASGYRLRMRSKSAQGVDEKYFVVKEDGHYRLLAMSEVVELTGPHVLELVERHDLDGARHWLDWAREEISIRGGDDWYRTSPFARLWTKGSKAEEPAIRRAVAALMAGGTKALAKEALASLSAIDTKSLSTDEQRAIRLAEMRAHQRLDQAKELLAVADELAKDDPDSVTLFAARTGALTELKRYDEAVSLAKARLKKDDRDAYALQSLILTAEQRGELKEAEGYLKTMIETGDPAPGIFNDAAWLGLFTGLTPHHVELGQRAVLLSPGNYATLHTLASIYASSGRPAEANQVILRAIAASPLDEPRAVDWFVFGRIAEDYGENDAAVTAYRKVEKPDADEGTAVSTWALAKQRLEILQKGKK